MAARESDAGGVTTTQDGVRVTSSPTGNWADDAMSRQPPKRDVVVVDGHVGGPPAADSHAVIRMRTERNINGELAVLTTVSEQSWSSSKSADVPAVQPAADADPGAPPQQQQRHFVVVAVDFGTALSGYAFAFVRDPCRAIHMMRRWDGGDPGVVNQKTPTALLLDPVGRFHSFGYTARDFYHDLDADEARQWLFFDKFKMTLHHDNVIHSKPFRNSLMLYIGFNFNIYLTFVYNYRNIVCCYAFYLISFDFAVLNHSHC